MIPYHLRNRSSDLSDLINREKKKVIARLFAEGARVGEKRGPADFRESHRRTERRVHRRVPDFHHGAIATGKRSGSGFNNA